MSWHRPGSDVGNPYILSCFAARSISSESAMFVHARFQRGQGGLEVQGIQEGIGPPTFFIDLEEWLLLLITLLIVFAVFLLVYGLFA
jgi:hypothetical protein